MTKRPHAGLSTCCLALQPDPQTAAALEATFAAREALFLWLDKAVPEGHSSDVVALNRLFYEPAREMFRLPAQMTVLAFRDWTRRRRGEAVEGIALDDRLFSIRTVSMASVATVDGRHQIPFRTSGYLAGWRDNATARLYRTGSTYEIRVATPAALPQEERSMATENIVGRIGRLIAGMAHGAVDSAEQANPRVVLEQAIREIEAAAAEVRSDLGKKTAERFRVEARRKELGGELAELDRTTALAVAQGRDDLAEAGIERQIDIEAQIGVLDALLRDIDDSISQFHATLDAVRASRREAETRLSELPRSQELVGHAGATGQAAGSNALAKVERAHSAMARVTGVPGGHAPLSPAVDELRQMAREHAVKERLARLQAGQ